MTAITLARPRSWLRDCALILGASFSVGLFAKVQIPLPFTPVPVVLQDTMLLFFGVLFGWKRGALIALVFLGQAALGWPVLAGGVGGVSKMLGATGGYIFGYVLATLAAGWISEKMGRTMLGAICGMLGASALLFTCGVSYLSTFVGLPSALLLGFVPFIPGNLIKTIAVLRLYRFLLRRA